MQRAFAAFRHPCVPATKENFSPVPNPNSASEPVAKANCQIVALDKTCCVPPLPRYQTEVTIIEFRRHRNAAVFPFNLKLSASP